jgi:hypothetical protein
MGETYVWKNEEKLQLLWTRDIIFPVLDCKVSDVSASSIQQQIVAFVKTTEFGPLETATSCCL